MWMHCCSKPQAAAKGQALIGAGTDSIGASAIRLCPRSSVLCDVTLEFTAGGFYGLVGHTGSGKSTLLSLLLRFYAVEQDASRSTVWTLGSSVPTISSAAVGYVPRTRSCWPPVCARTFPWGVICPRRRSKPLRKRPTATISSRNWKTATNVFWVKEGPTVSGRKAADCHSVRTGRSTRILFLDEATAHIDSATEQIVQLALSELRGQVTVVAVAHRLSTIRNADAIMVLNHGRVHEQGTHEDLMRIDRGVYQRLYLLQQMGRAWHPTAKCA